MADGTALTAVWAENSGGDVLLNSGNTVFYKSSFPGTEWEEKSEIRSVTGAVQEFCMWEEDGTVKLAYIKDGKLYMDGTPCDNITGKADNVKIFDGQIYFRLDGMLHRWENGSAVSLGTACTTSYRVLDDTVYWTEQDNFKSEIYKKEISVTGRPVAVTAEGGYIGGFSLLKQADGGICASVSAGEPFDSADQTSETLELETNAADLEITSVDEDTVCITNLSDWPAEEIKLEVKDGDETGILIQSGNIETLAPGEKKTISLAEAWESSTVNIQAGDCYLHCEVTQKADEYTLWNNNIQLRKQGSRPQPSASATPSPTPETTQKPQETVAPGKTAQPDNTEKPGAATPSPTPETTQKPQETVAPGKTAQPDNTEKPGASVTPVSSDPGKATIGKVSALKLKQKKHTVTVSWKKLTGAKGYQICYSTSKKWKGKKQKLVSKNKAVIKKLKKKKTYYFCVRAYRLEGAKKVYGAWSNMKKIKIKK